MNKPTGLRLLQTGYAACVLSALAVAILHPGLAAVRIGLGVVFMIPALWLGRGIFLGRPKTIAASLFFAILLLMPLIAEIWSEPEIRWLALLSSVITCCYFVGAIVYIRKLSGASTKSKN